MGVHSQVLKSWCIPTGNCDSFRGCWERRGGAFGPTHPHNTVLFAITNCDLCAPPSDDARDCLSRHAFSMPRAITWDGVRELIKQMSLCSADRALRRNRPPVSGADAADWLRNRDFCIQHAPVITFGAP